MLSEYYEVPTLHDTFWYIVSLLNFVDLVFGTLSEKTLIHAIFCDNSRYCVGHRKKHLFQNTPLWGVFAALMNYTTTRNRQLSNIFSHSFFTAPGMSDWDITKNFTDFTVQSFSPVKKRLKAFEQRVLQGSFNLCFILPRTAYRIFLIKK